MKENWIKLIKHLNNVDKLECPNCKNRSIDYLYIGQAETKIGYLQIWCNKCKKGIYISRVKIPDNAKFVSFEDSGNVELPSYEFL